MPIFKYPLIYYGINQLNAKRSFASFGKTRQTIRLTGKINFPYSWFAGGLAWQVRWKRFNQRFLKRNIFLKRV